MKVAIRFLVAITLLTLTLLGVAHAPALRAGAGMALHLPLVSVRTPEGIASRVSVSSDGTEGNFRSMEPAMSATGRFIAFTSEATNLVLEDANGTTTDVFVHDTLTGATTLVSIASDGTQGDDSSMSPSVSADGRFVAFSSRASNLVVGDAVLCTPPNTEPYTCSAVFVHDRQTGETTRVSVATDGTPADGDSESPALSADGRFVVFSSGASNLVAGDTTVCVSPLGAPHNCVDVFVHDRQTGETVRVSVASDGTPGNGNSASPVVSADGRFVAFTSDATNLVPGDTNLCPRFSDMVPCYDVFVHDRQTGETTRVSVAGDGAQGDSHAGSSAISADGRFVSFSSYASNLVAGDTNVCSVFGSLVQSCSDVFVHDRQTGATTRVSIASDGTQADEGGLYPALSADGRFVAFMSSATNLIPSDANYPDHMYVHDRQTRTTTRVSIASDGSAGNSGSILLPAISATGRYVAFQSYASNLVPDDTNNTADIFLYDRRID